MSSALLASSPGARLGCAIIAGDVVDGSSVEVGVEDGTLSVEVVAQASAEEQRPEAVEAAAA